MSRKINNSIHYYVTVEKYCDDLPDDYGMRPMVHFTRFFDNHLSYAHYLHNLIFNPSLESDVLSIQVRKVDKNEKKKDF